MNGHRKIRVCEVVCDLTDGGVESMLLNYFSNMSRENFDLHLITYAVSSESCKEKFMNLDFKIHVVCPKRDGLVRSLLEMDSAIKKIAPDVLHAHLTDWNCIPMVIGAKNGVQTRISHSHLGRPENGPVLHFLQVIAGLSFSTNYFACGEMAAENLFPRKFCNHRAVLIVNNAINTRRYIYNQLHREKLRSSMFFSDQVIVGHVGRFLPQKNHLFLVDAFFKFQQLVPNSKLLLFGRGELEEAVLAHVFELGLEDDILFKGTTDCMNEWYSALDLFVLPSLFEGLPVSVIEAACNGVPVLMSSGITKEAIVSQNVSRCDISDPEAWADAMNASLKTGRLFDFELPEAFQIEEQAKQLRDFYLDKGK